MPILKYTAKAEESKPSDILYVGYKIIIASVTVWETKLTAPGRCGMEKKGKPCQETAIKEMSETPSLFSSQSFHSSCCVSQQPTASFHVRASQRAQKKNIHHLYAIAPLKDWPRPRLWSRSLVWVTFSVPFMSAQNKHLWKNFPQ